MKKLLTLCLLAVTMCAMAQNKKVAIYVKGSESNISKVLGDQLVASFAKSGKYTAVERTISFLTELSKENDYQRNGAVNDNEIARLGMQLGVDYVCVAVISDVFGEKYITARLIDVETAEIINTHSVRGTMNSMDSCLSMANEIAERLSKSYEEQAIEDLQKSLDAYNVSYPEFCYNFRKYSKNNPAVSYFYDKYDGCMLAGNLLLLIPPAVALGTGLGIGAENKSMDPEIKAAVIIGSICGAALPSIICYSVAPVYKKKAWKVYRKPYDDIVKNNKYASASLSLQFSPVISYDMAGIGLRLNLY